MLIAMNGISVFCNLASAALLCIHSIVSDGAFYLRRGFEYIIVRLHIHAMQVYGVRTEDVII